VWYPPHLNKVNNSMSKADIKTRKTVNIKYPDRFKIVILNDDYTPFDFVNQLLVEIFNKPIEEAKKITSQVHDQGQGVVGYYNAEIAEQKVNEATVASRTAGYPLVVKVQKA